MSRLCSGRLQKLKEFASIADYVKITKLDFAAEKGDGAHFPSPVENLSTTTCCWRTLMADSGILSADGLVRAGLPPPELNGKPHITFKENVSTVCSRKDAAVHCMPAWPTPAKVMAGVHVWPCAPETCISDSFSCRTFPITLKKALNTTTCGARDH